jgi:hypothetical protein
MPIPLEQFEARLAQELEERVDLDWSAGVTTTPIRCRSY